MGSDFLYRATDKLQRTTKTALTRFTSDERGVTSIIFGLFIVAMLLVAAIAIDHSRIVTERTRDQKALDAALLAASTQLGLENQDITGEEMARAFYQANRSRGTTPTQLKTVKLDANTGEVSAATDTDWSASLLKSVEHFFPGIADDRKLSVSGRVRRGNGTTEIALVLDNSGSMSGGYLSDLKTAATDLLDTVFAGVEGTDRVTAAVVPFAAAVNVGSYNANSSWIDGGGASSTHYENFSSNRTRFQAFSDLGISWAGCVEARPGGLDVTDDAPTSGDTLFVPMFAPDEPGDAGSNSLGYNNSYVDDDGGNCTPYERQCTKVSRRGNCTRWNTIRLPNPEAQARTCKYRNFPPTNGSGPNYMCTTQAILPLNSTKSTIVNAINAMQASGNTNIKEGVAWGWRVLSPSAPFTEGRANGTDDNSKVIILMTDGENWYNHQNNHNNSIYASHGYAAKGRLGQTYSRSAYTTYLNARTRTVCENAKADGMRIYTVAFRLENDPTTTALLRDCASSQDEAFTASNGSVLIQAFRNIGRQITDLRISE